MKKFIFFITGLLIMSSIIYGQNSVKKNEANFIFGFGRLLNWSNYQNNIFIINVYGQSDVTDYINTLSFYNTSGGRQVQARQTSLINIANCNILFIPKGNISALDQIKKLLSGKQVLIVTESAGYTNSGADVSFSFKSVSAHDSVLSYNFNLNSIRSKNIKLSPEFIGFGMEK